jgi:hypothetical protein
MVVFRKDPCGMMCVLMTYMAIFYAVYVVLKWIILQTMVSRCEKSGDVWTRDTMGKFFLATYVKILASIHKSSRPLSIPFFLNIHLSIHRLIQKTTLQ